MTAFTYLEVQRGLNLGEPWETWENPGNRYGRGGRSLRTWTGFEERPDRGRVPVPIEAGTPTYRGPAAPWSADNRTEGDPGGRAGAPRGRSRNLAEKVVDVCRHNGLFLAIPTVRETWDGIGHAVRRSREPHPFHRLGVAVVTQNGGIGVAGHPVRCRSPPSESLRDCGRGCARAPSRYVHDTVHPHRYGAPLRYAAGHLGDECAAMSYTPLGHSPHAARSPARERACHGAPACAQGLRRVQRWHAPAGRGRAVRGGSPRRGVPLAAARGPRRARGARYALGDAEGRAAAPAPVGPGPAGGGGGGRGRGGAGRGSRTGGRAGLPGRA